MTLLPLKPEFIDQVCDADHRTVLLDPSKFMRRGGDPWLGYTLDRQPITHTVIVNGMPHYDHGKPATRLTTARIHAITERRTHAPR